MGSDDNSRRARRSSRPAMKVQQRRDSGDAFLRDPSSGLVRARTRDVLAESLAEQFVGSATAAQRSGGFDDCFLAEELGGPFVTTRARQEFGVGVDASNPVDAEVEPWPTVVSGLVSRVLEEDEEPDTEE